MVASICNLYTNIHPLQPGISPVELPGISRVQQAGKFRVEQPGKLHCPVRQPDTPLNNRVSPVEQPGNLYCPVGQPDSYNATGYPVE